jgi:hypothetical protein
LGCNPRALRALKVREARDGQERRERGWAAFAWLEKAGQASASFAEAKAEARPREQQKKEGSLWKESPPGVDLERTGCGDASACLYRLRTPLTPSG